jgi:hypothetical protein
VKSLAKTFHDENIPLSKVQQSFGGSSNPFDSRDCWNYVAKERLRDRYNADGDAEHVRRYFQERRESDPYFYFAIDRDEVGRAVNFFWVDSRARLEYAKFGDAVTFDTTYRTNMYKMPFAIFTGVNNHHQSILLGCALLENETESTFVWLFEHWLQAMVGKAPISIITDQDRAMRPAIVKVLPTTRHRYCIWHIKKKCGEKLGHIYFKKSTFKKTFKKCIFFTYTPVKFEEAWAAMIQEYGLEENKWLMELYEIREMWIPTYCRVTFFAGMNTTQRSESMNEFFNAFVSIRSSLRKFVEGYDKA